MLPFHDQNTAALRLSKAILQKNKEKICFCYTHIFKSFTSFWVLLLMTTQ